MRRALLLPLAALLAAACYTSRDPAEVPAAHDPRGVFGTIRMEQKRKFDAELLAVTDSAYLLAWNRHVGIARYRDVVDANFDEIGPMTFYRRREPPPAMLRLARRYSRFPYGVPDTALAAMLAASGQREVADFATYTPSP